MKGQISLPRGGFLPKEILIAWGEKPPGESKAANRKMTLTELEESEVSPFYLRPDGFKKTTMAGSRASRLHSDWPSDGLPFEKIVSTNTTNLFLDCRHWNSNLTIQ